MANSINALVDGFEVVAKSVSVNRILAKKVLGFVSNPALIISKDYPFTLLLEMSDGRIAGFRTPTDMVPELFPELFYIRDNDQPMKVKNINVYNLGYSFTKTATNVKHNHAALKETGRIPVKMVKGLEFETETIRTENDLPFQL